MAEYQLDLFPPAPAQQRLAVATAAVANSVEFQEFEARLQFEARRHLYVVYYRAGPCCAWQRLTSGRTVGEAWRRAYTATGPLVTFCDVSEAAV